MWHLHFIETDPKDTAPVKIWDVVSSTRADDFIYDAYTWGNTKGRYKFALEWGGEKIDLISEDVEFLMDELVELLLWLPRKSKKLKFALYVLGGYIFVTAKRDGDHIHFTTNWAAMFDKKFEHLPDNISADTKEFSAMLYGFLQDIELELLRDHKVHLPLTLALRATQSLEVNAALKS